MVIAKKTVWIVNQYAGSPYHGMEYRHYYMAKGLIKKGYRVYIISGSYSHLYTTSPLITGKFTFETIDGIEYCWVKIPKYTKSTSVGRIWNILVFMIRLFKIPCKVALKPDIIIVSSPSLFPIINATQWVRKYRAKLYFEVRDVWPLSLTELTDIHVNHPLIIIMQWFENYAYKKADKVISLLPNAKEHMMMHGMREDKFFYIPNGINLDDFKKTNPVSNKQLGQIPKNKFIVGYAGTLGVANALEYLIEAARLLEDNKDIYFVLVGNGSEKTKLSALSNNLCNVAFLDAIPRNQVQSMLENFDVCYIGLRDKKVFNLGISPNKIFDYLYSAKPILYSVPAIPPIPDAGICVSPDDPEAIVEAVLKFSEMNPETRKQMGRKGRDYVVSNHSYERLVEKYIQLFDE